MSDEPTEAIEEIEDEYPQKAGQHWEKAKKTLQKRCQAAGLEVRDVQGPFEEEGIAVSLPNGKEKRDLVFFSAQRLENFFNIPFEKFTYLGDYMAVVSYDDRLIEASVRSLQTLGSSPIVRRLFGISPPPHPSKLGRVKPIEVVSQDFPEIKLTLAFGTSVGPLLRALGPREGLTLRIDGLVANRHDVALRLLEKISNSTFFEIDLATGLPLALLRDRRRTPGLRRFRRPGEPTELEFPKHEYDPEPMALYWYARSATGMPLLQYLAFYQVIEFYFPAYSKLGASKRLRNILKDPNFRADRDSDIGKLLSAIGNTRGGFGDERGQLRSTLEECLDPESLRAFFNQNELRATFFSKKQEGLTDRKLPLANRDADLRNDVADLIYEIRCKIVHTKGQGAEEDFKLLLPFSREADLLGNYIDLVQYVAEQVLITTSTPIQL